MKTCIPGITVKRGNPCIDPMQNIIPHVIESYRTTDTGDIVFDGYKPNIESYPEYEFVIQMFINNYVGMK